MNPKDFKIFFLIVFTAIYAVSIDCPKLISFAFDLGMPSQQPARWMQLQSDCCTVIGVYCVGSRVIEISWYMMGLNGTINGTAIPSSVTSLYLNNNAITGSIPNNLPSGLLYLDLNENAITGFIPNALPVGLISLSLHGNQMSGDLPLFPSTLQVLYLGYPGTAGNNFTGTLRLFKPSELYINDNWITSVVIQDLSVLYQCDLSNNPLLGNPNIASLTMCTKNGLYSAALLPMTKTYTATSTATATATPTATPQPFRTQILQFAQALGIHFVQPAIWAQLQTDFCTANGISCDGNMRAIQIYWPSMGLNGTINEAAIPSSLTTLNLYNNSITGPIPSLLPSGLINLYLHGNQMSGDLPLFPSTLTHMYLGYPGYPGNHFTGTLRLSRPNDAKY